MKITFTAILIFLSCAAALAQVTDTMGRHHNDGKHKMEHDIQLNTTFFIKEIISLSNSNLEISPYIVGYKFFPVRNHGLRFSIGGSFSSKQQNPDSSFVQITKNNSLDYRVGYEYRHFFGKIWTFFAGVDVVNGFAYTGDKVNSSIDIVNTKASTWMAGIGPVAGIQVSIGKRVALFTETAFYYTYSKTVTKTSSLNFPELNATRTNDIEKTGKFLLPTSLYFVFRF